MSSNESKSNQALGRREPRHPDDVLPEGGGEPDAQGENTKRAANAKPEREAKDGASRNPPDAVPGREYQGSGVLNEHKRFGSSTRPEDLAGGDERRGDEGKR